MGRRGRVQRVRGKKFELVPNKFLLSPVVREECMQVTKYLIVTFGNDVKH